jgi:hypothetical protein
MATAIIAKTLSGLVMQISGIAESWHELECETFGFTFQFMP